MIEKEIQFRSGAVQLSGTVATPDSGGPFPAVLLVPGSGQVDRNEDHKKMAMNAFREITEYLVVQGFATLRYDKRGVGASEGDYWTTGMYDNAADASVAFDYLKTVESIQSDKLFILGHSEGAFIATMLAGRGIDAKGIVLVSGAAVSGEQALKWQVKKVAEGMGGLNKAIIKLFRIDITKAHQKQLDKIKRSTKNWYRVQGIQKLNAKWMREFLAYDPTEDLSKISVPVLAMTGSKDIQVDPGDLERMAELIKSDFEYHELSDVTHILRAQPGNTGLSNYKEQVKRPIDSRILELTAVWLKKQSGMPAE